MDNPALKKFVPVLDAFILNEAQLLLSEKRTAFFFLRTDIAIFAFPLAVLSVLIATSQTNQIHKVLYWLVPLLVLNVGLPATI